MCEGAACGYSDGLDNNLGAEIYLVSACTPEFRFQDLVQWRDCRWWSWSLAWRWRKEERLRLARGKGDSPDAFNCLGYDNSFLIT